MTKHDERLVKAGTERLLAVGWEDHEKYNDASKAVARGKAREMFLAALDAINASGIAWVAPCIMTAEMFAAQLEAQARGHNQWAYIRDAHLTEQQPGERP